MANKNRITVYHRTTANADFYYTDGDSDSRLSDVIYEKHINGAATVKFRLWNDTQVATENLLNDSFAGWDESATGPLEVGLRVRYSTVGSGLSTHETSGTLLSAFDGFITAIRQDTDGHLHITAHDGLFLLSHHEYDKIIYDSYYDRTQLSYSVISSGADTGYISATVDSTISFPPIETQLFGNDEYFMCGTAADPNGNDNITLTANDHAVAQSFINTWEGVYAILYWANPNFSVATTATVRIGIQGNYYDSGLGFDRPDGSWIAYTAHVFDNAVDPDEELRVQYPDSGPDAMLLDMNTKYWMVAVITDITAGDEVQMRRLTTGTYNSDEGEPKHLRDNGAGWLRETGNLCMGLLAGFYEDVEASEVEYESPTTIIIRRTESDMFQDIDGVPIEWQQDIKRVRLSYYYGSVDLADVFTDLITMCGMTPDVDANIDLTIPLFNTRGKSVLACLQELCTLYSYNDSGTYRQCVIDHYYANTVDNIHVGMRRPTSATSRGTFTRGVNIADVSLQRSAVTNPSGVVVIGKALNGMPLFAARDDRSRADSWRTQTRCNSAVRIYDEGVTSLEQASELAYCKLDELIQNVDNWAGSITVEGAYPTAVDYGEDETYAGDGAIITFAWAPIGLSATDFKVTGIIIHEGRTTMYITTKALITNNLITNLNRRVLQNESYLSPSDPANMLCLSLFKSEVETDTTMFAQLCSAASTVITDGRRVPCTILTRPSGVEDTRGVTYQAYFDSTNGYGTVERIEYYSEQSGGSLLLTYDISSEWASAAEFYKSKAMGVIIDLQCRDS